MDEFTKEQLVEASDWIVHEIWAFRGAYWKLKGDTQEQIVAVALLDSFLIHARSLHDFLYRKNKGHQKDDLLAKDYILGWSKDESTLFAAEKYRYKINTMLAHLTIKRKDNLIMAKWFENLDQIYAELNRDIDEFLVQMPDHLKGQRWQEEAYKLGYTPSSQLP